MTRYLSFTALLFLFLLIATVSSFYVTPLRAGTLHFTDAELRSSKKIVKNIDLRLTKDYYQSHKDINTVASITSIVMDDRLSFYFQYNIYCPDTYCVLNFTLVIKTKQVNQDFKYSFSVDWFVARGLKIMELNMTSYQEHLQLKHLISYNQKNERQNLGAVMPYNNQDALRLLLFPNGFSNLTRTGRVVYMYPMSSMNMFVVHYMEHENGHSELDRMGWPEGRDFIRYKALFFDHTYHPKGCLTDDKFTLQQNYDKTCNGGNKVKWFYGFKSTKQKQFKGDFTQLRSGYSFSLDKTPSRYGVLGFPFEVTDQFIDERDHVYKIDSEYESLTTVLVVIAVGLVLGFLAYYGYRHATNSCLKANSVKRFHHIEQRSESFQSQRDDHKQFGNVITIQPNQKV